MRTSLCPLFIDTLTFSSHIALKWNQSFWVPRKPSTSPDSCALQMLSRLWTIFQMMKRTTERMIKTMLLPPQPLSVLLPPPLEEMVQSWFIHKILAEHKRRGLHSSHSVTRWIPGEETRALPFSGRPQSYLALIGTRVFYPTVTSWLISWRLTWSQCLPPAGQSLLPGHFAKRRQRRRALRRLRQRSLKRYEWFDFDIKDALNYLPWWDLHNKRSLSWGGGGSLNNVLINRARFGTSFWTRPWHDWQQTRTQLGMWHGASVGRVAVIPASWDQMWACQCSGSLRKINPFRRLHSIPASVLTSEPKKKSNIDPEKAISGRVFWRIHMTANLNTNVLFMILISRRKNKKIAFQTWGKGNILICFKKA